jgi:hypothetical protein
VDAALSVTYQRRNAKPSDGVFVRDETKFAAFGLLDANDAFFAKLGVRFANTNANSTVGGRY